MNLSLQISANLCILGEPFLPFSMGRLKEMLNLPEYSWSDAGSIDLLPQAHRVNEPQLLFEKIEDDAIEAQVARLEATRTFNEMENTQMDVTPLKSQIVYDDFSKLDMRVGTVTAAENMPKSKKLLKLTIDTGVDVRTVLSGIAEHFSPDEVIGQQVTVLANLAPRKMMGIESEGMVLMAEDREGKLYFIQPTSEIDNGSVIS
jgi:methionyl-tRNA synthetase